MIGLRELFIIGVVALVLYGRSGVIKSRQARTILPWISPIRRPAGGKRPGGAGTMARPAQGIPGASLLRDGRLVWILTFLAATAIAAWIITRTLITSGAASGLKP
jgi:hypothetical protein